jgi:hypothetical protein
MSNRQTWCGSKGGTMALELGRCKDCELLEARLEDARKADMTDEQYVARQEKDDATITEQDLLDHKLGHMDYTPMHPCGRYPCLYCSMQACKLAEQLVKEILEEENAEENRAGSSHP